MFNYSLDKGIILSIVNQNCSELDMGSQVQGCQKIWKNLEFDNLGLNLEKPGILNKNHYKTWNFRKFLHFK